MNKSRSEIHWESKLFLGFNLTSHQIFNNHLCCMDTKEYKVNALYSKNRMSEKIEDKV